MTPGQNGPTLLPASYGPAFFDSDLAVFKNFQIKEGMKLQLRAQAYNFLNHPLYSFPSGSNLTLQFTQDPVSPGDHPGEYQLRHHNPEAGIAHYRVRSEVLLLTRQEYIKSNGNKLEGF